MAKKAFERTGNYFRFEQDVDGRKQKFEFYHEPFEGELSDNIDLFVEMYESGEPGRMQQGVNLLAQSKDERALPCLIKALKDTTFAGRPIAAAGLANYPGSKKAAKALLRTFTSGDYILTVTALKALGQVGYKGARRKTRRVLAQCLRREDLFTSADTAAAAAVLALACIATLLELGDKEYRPFLLRFLAHTEGVVRYHGAKVFMKFPDKNAETLLVKLLGDPNPLVQLNAAQALTKVENIESYEVMEKLIAEGEPGVRGAAIAALGELETPEADDIMERALQGEPDAGLRLEIAWRLRRRGRDAGLEEIRAALEHENPLIRQNAIRIASELGGQPELALLREALPTEPDEFLKNQIERKTASAKKA